MTLPTLLPHPMPWLRDRASVRRGLIVALDGLAIWLLAIVLAAYVDPGSVAGSSGSLVTTAVDTTRLWVTTPGTGSFEVLAIAGLAVTALSPLWYGVVRPSVRRRSLESPRIVRDPRRDGFRYDQAEAPARGSDGPFGRDRAPLTDTEIGPATRGDGTGLRRVADLFDPAPGEGDFLRGGSGRSANGPERPAEPIDQPEDEGNEPAAAPNDEIVVSMARPEEAKDVKITVGTDGDVGRTDGAADGGASARWPSDPVTSLDDLGPALAASQARLDTVSDRIAAATNGPGVETVAADVASIAESTDERLAPLRTIRPEEPLPIDGRLSEIRAARGRIESAFGTAFDAT